MLELLILDFTLQSVQIKWNKRTIFQKNICRSRKKARRMGGDAHRFNQSRRRFFVPQNRWSSENKEQSQAWLELCRVATEEDENQIKEIKEILSLRSCAQPVP